MEQTELEDFNAYVRTLEFLASGRNPFTGEKLPGDSILNDVRLVRCFFTAASLMRDCLASTESAQASQTVSTSSRRSHRRRNSIPFSISEEQKQNLLSQTPVKISAFRSAIRELVGQEMAVPQAGEITQWLVEQGCLKVSTEIIPGLSSKIPTVEGEELGISCREIRTPEGKRYMQCFYGKEAQEFILDNMENILGYPGEE